MTFSLEFGHPAGGSFSHFAHFISDFVLPCFSFLRRERLVQLLLEGEPITIEIRDDLSTRFGPLAPLVAEIFPRLEVRHVSRFSTKPIGLSRRAWHNPPGDVAAFRLYLEGALGIKPLSHGTILVQRGFDRTRYPLQGSDSSAADRRTIDEGLENLFAGVKAARPDAICLALENLSFREQVALFLEAECLIAQHGAAFVHAHWMPRGSTLLELQCRNLLLQTRFVPRIARLRGHWHHVIEYPCTASGTCLKMKVENPEAVTRLLARKREAPALLRAARLLCFGGG
ncbi:MAG TPA: glycosyltransferase family 61 protein [Verrucomicrobiae bacterium]|nr:glycosyltransferase family 61 protein [Verrucomicrobiae bacterium]